ncbi:TetR/AcrR family transcriptional regulator [Gymnodinialimonas ceratoperidinii]|uniref:TetR/AcrR family transcriptional regulator n=1 Tax=Gymnodinialimonas ceratoperidinii TaxID=2856823 RepID=A0A8F6YBM7_9RHOB|nr:TetR/AcrR family transcriptional regulator [Gymnodinialimonas ceratoperidinii]QXT41124.1 TetR/AcrR family transcriptional regulator [Gymnodinialimonas ceratoperidinii]
MTQSDQTARQPARDRLLQAAQELFYNHGINGTGIDTITATAGVAKKSLYNNFASKSDLVHHYLQARHEEWLALYSARVASAATPHARVLAVFDAYRDHAEFAYSHGFRGCGLLNAAAELEVGDPGRAAVRRHKEEVEAILAEHLAKMLPDDAPRAERVAAHVAYLLEGAMARAGLEGTSARLLTARTMVDDMLKAL